MKNLFKKIIILIIFVSVLSLSSLLIPNKLNAAGVDITNSSISCDLGSNPKLQDVLGYASCIISTSVIPLIFALAVVSFVWGVVQYVINSDDEAKKTKGRDFMIWGILALAVMVSVWGLVNIVNKTFGIQTLIPQLNTRN